MLFGGSLPTWYEREQEAAKLRAKQARQKQATRRDRQTQEVLLRHPRIQIQFCSSPSSSDGVKDDDSTSSSSPLSLATRTALLFPLLREKLLAHFFPRGGFGAGADDDGDQSDPEPLRKNTQEGACFDEQEDFSDDDEDHLPPLPPLSLVEEPPDDLYSADEEEAALSHHEMEELATVAGASVEEYDGPIPDDMWDHPFPDDEEPFPWSDSQDYSEPPDHGGDAGDEELLQTTVHAAARVREQERKQHGAPMPDAVPDAQLARQGAALGQLAGGATDERENAFVLRVFEVSKAEFALALNRVGERGVVLAPREELELCRRLEIVPFEEVDWNELHRARMRRRGEGMLSSAGTSTVLSPLSSGTRGGNSGRNGRVVSSSISGLPSPTGAVSPAAKRPRLDLDGAAGDGSFSSSPPFSSAQESALLNGGLEGASTLDEPRAHATIADILVALGVEKTELQKQLFDTPLPDGEGSQWRAADGDVVGRKANNFSLIALHDESGKPIVGEELGRRFGSVWCVTPPGGVDGKDDVVLLREERDAAVLELPEKFGQEAKVGDSCRSENLLATSVSVTHVVFYNIDATSTFPTAKSLAKTIFNDSSTSQPSKITKIDFGSDVPQPMVPLWPQRLEQVQRFLTVFPEEEAAKKALQKFWLSSACAKATHEAHEKELVSSLLALRFRGGAAPQASARLVLAGGSVFKSFLGQNQGKSDLDFFLVAPGSTEQDGAVLGTALGMEAVGRIHDILRRLGFEILTVQRSRNAITWYVQGWGLKHKERFFRQREKQAPLHYDEDFNYIESFYSDDNCEVVQSVRAVQLLGFYDTLGSVLEGFDLPCCQVLMTGVAAASPTAPPKIEVLATPAAFMVLRSGVMPFSPPPPAKRLYGTGDDLAVPDTTSVPASATSTSSSRQRNVHLRQVGADARQQIRRAIKYLRRGIVLAIPTGVARKHLSSSGMYWGLTEKAVEVVQDEDKPSVLDCGFSELMVFGRDALVRDRVGEKFKKADVVPTWKPNGSADPVVPTLKPKLTMEIRAWESANDGFAFGEWKQEVKTIATRHLKNTDERDERFFFPARVGDEVGELERRRAQHERRDHFLERSLVDKPWLSAEGSVAAMISCGSPVVLDRERLDPSYAAVLLREADGLRTRQREKQGVFLCEDPDPFRAEKPNFQPSKEERDFVVWVQRHKGISYLCSPDSVTDVLYPGTSALLPKKFKHLGSLFGGEAPAMPVPVNLQTAPLMVNRSSHLFRATLPVSLANSFARRERGVDAQLLFDSKPGWIRVDRARKTGRDGKAETVICEWRFHRDVATLDEELRSALMDGEFAAAPACALSSVLAAGEAARSVGKA